MLHDCCSILNSLFNTHSTKRYKINMSNFSLTVWRHCWAVRIMRAAPLSTTLADWVSMTQWRTCWASRGRSASNASPRTRSLPCTLLPSEFQLVPEGMTFHIIELNNTDLTWFSFFDQIWSKMPAMPLLLTLTSVGCSVYTLLLLYCFCYVILKVQHSISRRAALFTHLKNASYRITLDQCLENSFIIRKKS